MHLSWTFQVVVHFTAKAEEAEAKITVVLVKKSGRGLGLSVVLSSFAEWCQNDVRMRSQCWNVAGGTERRSGSFHLGSCPRWARWTERRLDAGIFTIFPGKHLFTIFPGKHLTHFPGKHLYCCSHLHITVQGDQIIRVNSTDLTNATQVNLPFSVEPWGKLHPSGYCCHCAENGDWGSHLGGEEVEATVDEGGGCCRRQGGRGGRCQFKCKLGQIAKGEGSFCILARWWRISEVDQKIRSRRTRQGGGWDGQGWEKGCF